MKNIQSCLICHVLCLGLAFVLTLNPACSSDEKPESSEKQSPDKKEQSVRTHPLLKAPHFSLQDLKGNTVSLSEFKEKVVILNFWAIFCPSCRKGIPEFIELYNQYKDRGLEIIGVSLDRGGVKQVLPFVRKNNINYTILIGDQNIVRAYGGIQYIPTTFVIDPHGNIYKGYVGVTKKSQFEKDIAFLLSQ